MLKMKSNSCYKMAYTRLLAGGLLQNYKYTVLSTTLMKYFPVKTLEFGINYTNRENPAKYTDQSKV